MFFKKALISLVYNMGIVRKLLKRAISAEPGKVATGRKSDRWFRIVAARSAKLKRRPWVSKVAAELEKVSVATRKVAAESKNDAAEPEKVANGSGKSSAARKSSHRTG